MFNANKFGVKNMDIQSILSFIANNGGFSINMKNDKTEICIGDHIVGCVNNQKGATEAKAIKKHKGLIQTNSPWLYDIQPVYFCDDGERYDCPVCHAGLTSNYSYNNVDPSQMSFGDYVEVECHDCGSKYSVCLNHIKMFLDEIGIFGYIGIRDEDYHRGCGGYFGTKCPKCNETGEFRIGPGRLPVGFPKKSIMLKDGFYYNKECTACGLISTYDFVSACI